MSAVTLDTEIVLANGNSKSLMNANTTRRHPTRNCHGSESILWGYDEHAERASYDQVQRRLLKLESALFEEFGNRFNLNSKDCLTRLFMGFPSVRSPLISASPEGTLVATWRCDDGEELVIQCLSSSCFNYSIISRSQQNPIEFERQWGTFRSGAPIFFSSNPLAKRIARK